MGAIIFVLFFGYANAAPVTTGLQFASAAACQQEAQRLMRATATPNGKPITGFQCQQTTLEQ